MHGLVQTIDCDKLYNYSMNHNTHFMILIKTGERYLKDYIF